MKLTIDNHDGKGAVDYSASIVAQEKFRLERRLNAPSLLTVSLLPAASSLASPERNGRVVLANDAGQVFFTGYVASEPAQVLAGVASIGAVYLTVLSAISDEVLLDRIALLEEYATYGESASTAFEALAGGLGVLPVTTSLTTTLGEVGQFLVQRGGLWSQTAATLAANAYSAYRVQQGVLSAATVGSSTHSLSESEGSLALAGLSAAQVKMLANDITVCGEVEPSAYVTEYFAGDGVTTVFDLSETPFKPTTAEDRSINDSFAGSVVNPMIWNLSDANYFALTSAGFTSKGGSGADNDTYLRAIGHIELGGSILFETNGVQFGANTVGILNGIYNGYISAATCIAGFQISLSNGASAIAPLVGGSVAGPTFTPVSGHQYTLRLRFYSNENQRISQYYYYQGPSGIDSTGGHILPAAGSLVLEVQDTSDGVAGAVTVLYSASFPQFTGLAIYAPLNSIDLACSIGNVTVTHGGPTWVMSTPPGGTPVVRRLGTTAQGADCKIADEGKLTFYAASTPKLDELIAVSYRTRHRAVARVASAASIAAESAGGVPGTSVWAGRVSSPLCRSTLDCYNAAQALVAVATNRAAAWSGHYTGWNMEQTADVWPGDVLVLESASAGLDASVVVRAVQIDFSSAAPELTRYTVQFANEWAEDLAIKTSTTIPEDVWLPTTPQATAPLANLNTLAVSLINGSQINVSAGVSAPSGGGFEVRRRDWAFGPGTDVDLVLRSPVPNFIIPREAVTEQYYVRMYDAATPPNYSPFSAAIFVNLPLGSTSST